ncbi:MAG: dihydrodipicolinate synthase family protein [Actinobacteria bacterium]|nr:dihydrodipicolinate synthase family protein [Actinomycetota bacterium]
MDRSSVDWRGYWPACPTPFKANGDLDFDSLAKMVDWYLSQKMHGLFVLGTTGEWFSQSNEERNSVAEAVIKQVDGRIPVVVGVTTFTAKDSARLADYAMKVGASGICSSAPAYAKTLPDETVAYFEDLSRMVPAPLMIYNWPHGTNIEVEGELAERLADLEYVVAIKDSTGNAEQFRATTASVIDRVRIFGNFMTTGGLEVLENVGGDGTIGGGSIFGASDPKYWEDYWSGDIESVRKSAQATDQLLASLWGPGGWRGLYGAYQSQLKVIMEMMGVPGGTVRPPRLPITDSTSLAKIRKALIDSNIELHGK